MKDNRIFMLCAAFLITICALTSASAQTVRSEKKVPEEQVPVAIRNTFQQEFTVANETKPGAWYIYFEQDNNNGRPTATPLSYIYRTKTQDGKVEIKYDAKGKFEGAKGIARKETPSSSSSN